MPLKSAPSTVAPIGETGDDPAWLAMPAQKGTRQEANPGGYPNDSATRKRPEPDLQPSWEIEASDGKSTP